MTTFAVPALGDVALRPVGVADRDFLLAVYAATRDEELSQIAWGPDQREAFLRSQFDLQDRQYRAHNPGGTFDVIEVGHRPAGRLYVDRRPDDVRVVDIALLPEFRGWGVGAFLLRRVQSEAADTGRSVSIHVETLNRAAELYCRLGFVVVADLGVYRRMEWRAA